MRSIIISLSRLNGMWKFVAVVLAIIAIMAIVGQGMASEPERSASIPTLFELWDGEVFVMWYGPIDGICETEPSVYLQVINIHNGSFEFVEIPFWYCTAGNTYAYWNRYWSPEPGHRYYLNVVWIDYEIEPGTGIEVLIPDHLRYSPWWDVFLSWLGVE